MKFISSISKNGTTFSFNNIKMIGGSSASTTSRGIASVGITKNRDIVYTKNRTSPIPVKIKYDAGSCDINGSDNDYTAANKELELNNFTSHMSYNSETGEITLISDT